MVSLRLSSEAKVKLERANIAHAETLDLLRSALSLGGYVVEQNKLVDAFSRLKTGPAIFEVKTGQKHYSCE